ncbi:glycosyl hydrolase 53 family protein [Demequina salsinemoris]|uniref:glycosyl hydrolase 53 family protein n=1 Tax=Demequina salsinemoris TaxID=577470 RepID=UPI0007851886|nr:glycosyl hydrolase 53 family protein [Demequina salsinemoris]
MAQRRATAAAAALTLAIAGTALAATSAAGDKPPVKAGVTVHKVEGLSSDFMTGVDVSSAVALEDSGVVFRDAHGKARDLFDLLADSGVTDVRVRVWNDPYDADGNGYGGGTVDADRALEIGERATAAGMGVVVDFHYSDFWADPSRQTAPKEWTAYTVAQKADAVYAYTEETLAAMADAGVDVTMVQVGNETNNAIAGVSLWASADGMADAAQLFNAGSSAVRAVYPDAKVALHFTDPQDDDYAEYAAALKANDVDYDVFASSYYPFWHGTTDNLTAVLSEIAADYGKEVMVAETSWAYTLEDGDGFENTIDQASEATQYWVSQQGQADEYRAVVQAVADVGDAGIGAFYWEPAWLPVGTPDDLEANKALWEEFGSGWATSFAADYDANVGEWYGGSSWDNQALFGFDGTALDSLGMFSYVRTGSIAPLAIEDVENPTVELTVGDDIVLPDTVTVSYNDGTTEEQTVEWDDVLGWISGTGTFPVSGVTSDGHATTATVFVSAERLVNGDFENGDTSIDPWWVENWPHTFWPQWVNGTQNGFGDWALNVWDASDYTFNLKQDVTGLPAGEYVLSAKAMGAPALSLHLYAWTESVSSPGDDSALTDWPNWDTMSLTVSVKDGETLHVGIYGEGAAGAWGWIDDVSLVEKVAPGADTTDLEALLADADSIDRSLYADWSLDALDHAAGIARVVAGSDAAVQDDVDAASDMLAAALESLVPAPDGSCAIAANPNGDGFRAVIKVANLTSDPLDQWTLTWGLGPGDQVDSVTNAGFVQEGQDVTVTSLERRSPLRPGKQVTVTVRGTTPTDAPTFAEPVLNGVACEVAS